MKKCPNCGRPTARTKDWACLWCGYPLLSRSYRGMAETYQELKAERLHRQESAEEEKPERLSRQEPTVEKKTEDSSPSSDDSLPSVQMLEHRLKQMLESRREAMSPPMKITVEEVDSAFKADSAAAEEQFANKTLAVTGIVGRVAANDIIDNPCIVLTSADKTVQRNVLCVFDKKYGSELDRLTKEQRVTVRGKYDGCAINILMRDCVLVD